MDQNHFTTDTLRKKGAHLTFEERVIIQTRLRDKQSYRSIAREIGCCVNTVRNAAHLRYSDHILQEDHRYLLRFLLLCFQ